MKIGVFLSLIIPCFSLEIDPLKHHVTPVSASKFDSVINKHRSWQVGAVFFYHASASDKATKTAFSVFDSAAKDLQGMFRFAAVDCDKDAKFCEENNVLSTPSVFIYPRHPMSAFAVPKLADKTDLVKTLNKQLPSEHIKTLDKTNIDDFLSTSQGNYLPKVVLFSSKATAPPLFKALSNEFRNEMQFGLVNFEASPEIAAKFKVVKAGTLAMQEVRQNKPVVSLYKGELNYPDIQTWVNLRRETFVKGGGFSESSGGGAGGAGGEGVKKPWRFEEVPELTNLSANDVCFKQEQLCLIYLREGKMEAPEIAKLVAVKNKFASELASLKLGYIDLVAEPAFKEVFLAGDYARELPAAVLFNPHKRLRFSALSEGAVADQSGLANLLERALSGDARYKAVKEIPAFSKRKVTNDEL